MKKNEFEFQDYYRKWLCAFPCLLIIIILNAFLMEIFQKKLIFYFVTGIMMFILLTVYYKLTKNRFIGKGFYYKENDLIVIEVGKKKYEINDVTEIIGSVKNVYSNKYAELFIKANKKQIQLFSKPLKEKEEFKESSIYDIYEFILENNKNLKKVESLEQESAYWLKK